MTTASIKGAALMSMTSAELEQYIINRIRDKLAERLKQEDEALDRLMVYGNGTSTDR